MLFWIVAALRVVGALTIVGGLYLLVRRWLKQSEPLGEGPGLKEESRPSSMLRTSEKTPSTHSGE